MVAAMGNEVDDSLYYELKGRVKELYRAGDCVAPRKADMAIYEGYMVGRPSMSKEKDVIVFLETGEDNKAINGKLLTEGQ